MNSPLKFQQVNSELSHMKHCQELYQSDLQAVKIQLGYFLRMFHMWQLRIKLLKFQWRIYFALPFTMGDLFFWNKYWFANRSQFDPLPHHSKCGLNIVSDWIGIYLQNQYLFQKKKSSPMLKDSGSQCLVQTYYDGVRDQIGIYLQNQYLFQKNKSLPMLKDRAKWNPHWLPL